jgi:hypothetical protein
MPSPADFLRLPYTPDLTEGGIEYALRSLASTYEREGRSPYGRLRRLVANIAVEVAFRRYLSQNNIPYEVKAAAPFSDRERFDVILDGRRCDIKSFLISRRDQISEIRKDPAVLTDAHALVPSDSHAGDGHSYNDLYLFAFMSGLVAASPEDLKKVLAKKQPHHLVHVMPDAWSKPQNWIPLGALTLKSESAEELIVEIHGQDEAREMKRKGISLQPGVKVRLDESFYSITSLHVKRLPEARLGIRCERIKDAHIVAPHEWGNIWVYGMDIWMTGYTTYEEMGQRATLLLPNSRTFQYERTHVKNLAMPVSRLKPMSRLFDTGINTNR